MASSSLMNINGGKTTTDAALTTIITVPIDFQAMRMEVSTIAHRPSNHDVKTWEQIFLVERHNGGPSITGGLLDVITPIGTPVNTTLWDVSVTVSGNNVLVQVKGLAGATIDWFASAVCLCIMED